jgi:hypothetical protein
VKPVTRSLLCPSRRDPEPWGRQCDAEISLKLLAGAATFWSFATHAEQSAIPVIGCCTGWRRRNRPIAWCVDHP